MKSNFGRAIARPQKTDTINFIKKYRAADKINLRRYINERI